MQKNLTFTLVLLNYAKCIPVAAKPASHSAETSAIEQKNLKDEPRAYKYTAATRHSALRHVASALHQLQAMLMP